MLELAAMQRRGRSPAARPCLPSPSTSHSPRQQQEATGRPAAQLTTAAAQPASFPWDLCGTTSLQSLLVVLVYPGIFGANWRNAARASGEALASAPCEAGWAARQDLAHVRESLCRAAMHRRRVAQQRASPLHEVGEQCVSVCLEALNTVRKVRATHNFKRNISECMNQ